MHDSPIERHRHRLLVVAPDPDLLESLVTPLGLAGYGVAATGTGAEALAMNRAQRFDLIIVDDTVPDVEDLGSRLRLTPEDRPPILCLTTCDQLDRLVPELGSRVEDYVTKPCRITELLARTQVLLRDHAPSRRVGPLCHGDLLLDDAVCRAWRGERPLDLTAAEYRLLRYLLINAGQVLTKEQLAWQVWGESRDANAIERLVSRLRQKVDAGGPAMIQTRRGFGYSL
ncbi:response regulator transcription factor [Winogradskya humida]|uniref:DNA-binding response regulator n=1 Tax=Winogradskya humida TaxID=113566 RepID=A0ABQ3ZJZ6_9ACTN|nr:response regulator transcription factor [Actinoplanes humidus]GIE18910.1 DNA-binding response regulator [Actinoplanes humidus]